MISTAMTASHGDSVTAAAATITTIEATPTALDDEDALAVKELERAGYLTKTRDGRRNHYEVHDGLPLRHPDHRHHTVGDLIRFLQPPTSKKRGRGGVRLQQKKLA
jgi:hypothetical protein